MDDGTLFDLIGKTASLIIDGRLVDGVMVTGNHVSSSGPGYIEGQLPTLIGEPDKRRRLRLDQIDLAP